MRCVLCCAVLCCVVCCVLSVCRQLAREATHAHSVLGLPLPLLQSIRASCVSMNSDLSPTTNAHLSCFPPPLQLRYHILSLPSAHTLFPLLCSHPLPSVYSPCLPSLLPRLPSDTSGVTQYPFFDHVIRCPDTEPYDGPAADRSIVRHIDLSLVGESVRCISSPVIPSPPPCHTHSLSCLTRCKAWVVGCGRLSCFGCYFSRAVILLRRVCCSASRAPSTPHASSPLLPSPPLQMP